MTKVEIIRELTKCNPQNIKSLSIIYHNRGVNVRYPYIYEFSHSSLEARRELAMVLLSLYKLRRYVEGVKVVYFPFDDYDECVTRYFCDTRYVDSISDFVKCIKPIKK